MLSKNIGAMNLNLKRFGESPRPVTEATEFRVTTCSARAKGVRAKVNTSPYLTANTSGLVIYSSHDY
jgi:hypothetical protein